MSSSGSSHASTSSSKLFTMNDAAAQTRQSACIVHGRIELDAFVWKIIDTPQFQRLRELHQLGTTTYVWPCATHTRFEHSLGVAFLARKLALHLKHNQPELKITNRDVYCVEIAGLCHDLGHGPFSHVFDGKFMPKVVQRREALARMSGETMRVDDSNWSHEQASVMMLEFMLKANDLHIEEADLAFIKALIDGKAEDCPQKEKPFLFEIVANKRNGLDVDKYDYLLRDLTMFGSKTDFSVGMIFNSCRVIDNRICYDSKVAHSLDELTHKRFHLHRSHYNHKTAVAVEGMICDILLEADPVLRISESIHDPERYQWLDDTIIRQIARTDDPRLLRAKELINRIQRRDLYKCVDYNYCEYSDLDACRKLVTPRNIVERANVFAQTESLPSIPTSPTDLEERDSADELADEGLAADLTEDMVTVDVVSLHHGMKEKDPLKFVDFYSKHNPNQACLAPRGAVTTIRLASYAEVLVRVYTKDKRFFNVVQAGYRALMQEIDGSTTQELKPELSQSISPPTTEAPTTPKQTSSPSPSFTPNPFTTTSQENSPQRKKDASFRKIRSEPAALFLSGRSLKMSDDDDEWNGSSLGDKIGGTEVTPTLGRTFGTEDWYTASNRLETTPTKLRRKAPVSMFSPLPGGVSDLGDPADIQMKSPGKRTAEDDEGSGKEKRRKI
ncbi:hypothetical protein DL96DRAFT_1606256 [Flagelloscypha sp. PMI_526]|nr:hypothetical protein DL96DRAFT_1606256 [Flagelloscypha sp. PMI_526]